MMKSMKFFLPILCLVLLLVACKKDDVVPFDQTPDQDLIITIQEQYVNPPSRVSVFFKVETKAGEPVAGLTEENFNIYEKGRNDDVEKLLSQDETTRILADNSQLFEYRTMLVLDLSGSVLNNSLPQLKAAANAFVDDVFATTTNTSNNVGIWWFDGRDVIHSLINFNDDVEALHTAINSINESISDDSSTDLFGAVIKSAALAENKLQEAQNQGVLSAVSIIMFTDGTDQAARYSREEAYAAVDNASEGIKFYTIGLGAEIDETVLNRVGKTSSVFADDTAALTETFEEVARLIADESNAYYLFEYCTPKRNGSGLNDLHIVAHKDNKEGRKITSFDATGFSDDCDLD
ncbi:MAG: hypothetical protein ACI81W_002446 [Saprospiraceae bacterium]|jgi:uncharacterized protein YegL